MRLIMAYESRFKGGKCGMDSQANLISKSLRPSEAFPVYPLA